MLDHWEAIGPPVYISVASYLGLTKKRTTAADTVVENSTEEGKTEEEKYGNLNDLAGMFSSSGGLIT